MSDSPSQSSPSEAPSTPSDAAAPSSSDAPAEPKRRRRRRRRGGKGKGDGKGPAAAGGHSTASAPSAAALDPGLAALAGGLLSHVDDREVPCAAAHCSNTWTWTAAEQIQAFGQPPPRRECESCGTTAATEVGCSVDGCKRTWTWSKEAQLKHKQWAKKRGSDRGGRSGRRRRRGEGTPRRKCDLCHKKHALLEERPSACKVHGCTRPVTIDRESQLRAWAALGTTDLAAEGSLPKHMCDVCREFCRTHDDRKVPCGRPGCERSWVYKRGAQLQAFLAGRFEDPLRMCGKCASEARNAAVADRTGSGVPANVDVMPCIVPGCAGNWHFRPGMKIGACSDGEQPTDRMCDRHRAERGEAPRMVVAPDDDVAQAPSSESGPTDHTSEGPPGPTADALASTEENCDADSAIS